MSWKKRYLSQTLKAVVSNNEPIKPIKNGKKLIEEYKKKKE